MNQIAQYKKLLPTSMGGKGKGGLPPEGMMGGIFGGVGQAGINTSSPLFGGEFNRVNKLIDSRRAWESYAKKNPGDVENKNRIAQVIQTILESSKNANKEHAKALSEAAAGHKQSAAIHQRAADRLHEGMAIFKEEVKSMQEKGIKLSDADIQLLAQAIKVNPNDIAAIVKRSVNQGASNG